MMPSKIKPLTPFQGGPMHHIGGGSIGPDTVKIRRGESPRASGACASQLCPLKGIQTERLPTNWLLNPASLPPPKA